MTETARATRAAINRLSCGNTAHSCKADYIRLAITALEDREKLLAITAADNMTEQEKYRAIENILQKER